MIDRRRFLLAAGGLIGLTLAAGRKGLSGTPRNAGNGVHNEAKPEEMPELIAEEASALWEGRA
jgi:hypothetical protein